MRGVGSRVLLSGEGVTEGRGRAWHERRGWGRNAGYVCNELDGQTCAVKAQRYKIVEMLIGEPEQPHEVNKNAK